MELKEFFEKKERICKIYNGSPGVIKEPHEACPFKIAMRIAGVEDTESCHNYIIANPEIAEGIVTSWEDTHPLPTNAEVFIKSLQEIDNRYTLENNEIYHNGTHIGKLTKAWAEEQYNEI